MKDKPSSVSKSFPFIKNGFVSYPIKVTILLIILIVVSVNGSYPIENAEAQLTITSSVSELIEQGNSLLELDKYEEAITWYNKALELDLTMLSL